MSSFNVQVPSAPFSAPVLDSTPHLGNSENAPATATWPYEKPQELIQALRAHPLFKGTPPDLVDQVCHVRFYHPGDQIIKYGELGKALFLIVKGTVTILSKDNEVEYREMGPGSFFGEIAVLFLIKRTANVVAKTRCILGVITSTEFQVLLRDCPELASKIRLEAEQRYAMFKERYLKETLDEDAETSTICDQINMGSLNEDLLKIPLFMNCSESFIHSLSLRVQPKKYGINCHIIQRGEKGKEMFVLKSGQCQVLDEDKEVLSTFEPGMFFGEIAIMMNVNRTEDVVSITPVEVYVISSEAVHELMDAYPAMKDRIEKASKTTYNLWKIRETRKEVIKMINENSLQKQKEKFKAIKSEEVLTASANSTSHERLEIGLTGKNDHGVIRGRTRRDSVAIWSDAELQKKLQNFQDKVSGASRPSSALSQARPKSSTSTTPASFQTSKSGIQLQQYEIHPNLVKNVFSFQPLNSHGIQVLRCVISRMSPLEFCNWRKVSKGIRNYIDDESGLFKVADFSEFPKVMTNEKLKYFASKWGSNLQTLNLRGCWKVTDDGLKNSMVYLPVLRELHLFGCWDVTSNGLAPLYMNCPMLTCVDLTSCRKVTDEGIISLLERCTNIQTLILSYCKSLTDKLFSKPALFLPVRKLHLQRCSLIRDDGFKKWLTAGEDGSPMKLFRMEDLNLGDCSFLTNETVKVLSACCLNLISLSVSFCCSLTETCAENICKFKKLVALDVSFCGSAVSDLTLGEIGTELPKLESVNIRGCVRVTDVGITKLLHGVIKIKYLNATQCNAVSKEKLKELEQKGLLKSNVVSK